jgi:hypothetical protein
MTTLSDDEIEVAWTLITAAVTKGLNSKGAKIEEQPIATVIAASAAEQANLQAYVRYGAGSRGSFFSPTERHGGLVGTSVALTASLLDVHELQFSREYAWNQLLDPGSQLTPTDELVHWGANLRDSERLWIVMRLLARCEAATRLTAGDEVFEAGLPLRVIGIRCPDVMRLKEVRPTLDPIDIPGSYQLDPFRVLVVPAGPPPSVVRIEDFTLGRRVDASKIVITATSRYQLKGFDASTTMWKKYTAVELPPSV